MPRQARIVVPCELFHLTQRGNYRQRIFEDNIDRAHYLKLFEEYKNKYGLELFAFCLGEHIKRAIKYVERNPVRAKMVMNAWDYQWSSARAHLGVRYNIITLSDCAQYVGDINWRDFIGESEQEDQVDKIREITMKGLVMGTQEQINNLESKLVRSKLPKPVGRPKRTRN